MVGRTVDQEATRRLQSELGNNPTSGDPNAKNSTSAITNNTANKGKSPLKRQRTESSSNTQEGGSAAGEGAAGEGGDNADVVYRWHVDNLLGGMDMDLFPVVEAGVGEFCIFTLYWL